MRQQWILRRCLVCLVCILNIISFCYGEMAKNSAGKVILENSNARWQFDRQSFGLVSIELKAINSSSTYSYIQSSVPNQIWRLSFRDTQGIEYIVDGSASTQYMQYDLVTSNSTAALYLQWINTSNYKCHDGSDQATYEFPTEIQATNSYVNVSVQILLQPSGFVDSKLSIGPVGESLALFQYNFMIVSDLGSGRLATDVIYVPNEFGRLDKKPTSWRARYPSGEATMPFMLYHTKELKKSPFLCHRGFGLFYGVVDPAATQKDLVSFSTFRANLFPENNVGPMTGPIESVHFLVGPFCGDWWDGAQIYRNWVLKNAPWTKAGPTMARKDVPQWFKDTTLWINSHWTNGPLDNSLGDPFLFERNVNRFLAVFNKSKYFNASNVAAHWYVWHDIPWETNIPNYFPAKEHFDEVTTRLQAQGVRVLPYINGRLYDINNQSWVREEAEIHCCKASAARLLPSRTSWHLEEYTTDQQLAVMCPTTSFWRKKLTSLTSELAKKHLVDGAYIDQLSSRPGVLCYDPEHKHPRGGGSYWSDGYNDALIQIRSEIDNSFVLVSDSNTEVYMPYLAGYLVKNGYRNCPVPLFQAVYSDYTTTFGAYFPGSFTKHPERLTKQMAQMFVYGTQLGWFALDGVDGLLNFFEDESNAYIVDYITTLMRYRTLGSDYFNGGQLMRPLQQGNSTDNCAAVASAAWSSREKNSLAIFIVHGGMGGTEAQVVWQLDVVLDYEMNLAKSYSLSQVMLSGEVELLQTFNSTQIEFQTKMPGLDVTFYELRPV